jgi:hypothetical protein
MFAIVKRSSLSQPERKFYEIGFRKWNVITFAYVDTAQNVNKQACPSAHTDFAFLQHTKKYSHSHTFLMDITKVKKYTF